MVMYMFAGALQLASSAERLHQRVDPDASRHQGRALHRFARVRPALQAGPGQEGPRGAQENLSQSQQPSPTHSKDSTANSERLFHFLFHLFSLFRLFITHGFGRSGLGPAVTPPGWGPPEFCPSPLST